MKKTDSAKRAAAAERIARMADEWKDVSRFFASDGKMMPPLQGPHVSLVSSDFAQPDDKKQ